MNLKLKLSSKPGRYPFFSRTKLFILAAFVSALVYSCKKDLGSLLSTEKAYSPEELQIETFRKYYLELVKKEGKVARGFSGVSSKTKPNLKHAIWKKAHYTKTKTGSFVEVPLLYNQRSGLILKKNRKNDKSIDKEIFNGSFDRLILYKVDGSTEYKTRIVSFIPDIDYLRKHNGDVSHNRLSKMDKDFTGFLEYKKWDGTRLSIHQKEKGRTIRIAFSKQEKENLGKKAGSQNVSLMSEGECGVEIVPIMGESCIGAGPESDTDQECTEYIIDYELVPIPCQDPCELYGVGCDGELTGDDCIDYGIGCDDDPGSGGLPGVDMAQLIALENEYKSRMSQQELAIYNNMSMVKRFAYLTNAKQSETTAGSLYPASLYNGKGDAFRHAFFHALNVISLGATLSESLGTAHEASTPSALALEKQMDLFNNAVGRNYLIDGDVGQSPQEYVAEALTNGSLKYLDPLDLGGSIIPGVTVLKPTNQ